ncbi:hypothetical protein [Brucella sp. 191011898]|uniref:hypothetical protein n=1 Tax=Brucella sp. 191011898 TaxID=2730447 RepID=UPI0015DE5664|nr:hypothetical protein [Brucella sp. 191011898]CAB4327683.1 hypothetical protein BCH_03108 [Brucella sp. 191011898]
MADLRLRINELPEELNPAPIDNIAIDGPSTRRTTLQRAADAVRPYSNEAMAREGLNNASVMTPLRVSQAIETLGGQRFATAQQGNKADTAVQPTLTISAGAGLTGGGTLAANREIALNSASIASLALANSAVQPTRQVIAGAGLSGGGDLSADRALSLSPATQASIAKADTAIQAPGGTAGQVLTKSSEADNDVAWQNVAAATAVSYGPQSLNDAQRAQARANIGAPVGEFRNVIINPLFDQNQRVVSGTVVLSAGQYGHDRYKAGSSGCTYTFSTNNGVTTIDISSGTLAHVVEASAFAGRQGEYVLSWAGTASCRINGGSYGASGSVKAILTGGANVTIEIGVGTISVPQLELGYVTDFSGRAAQAETALCQRYFAKTFALGIVPANGAGFGGAISASTLSIGEVVATWQFPQLMRTPPSMTFFNPGSGASGMWRNFADTASAAVNTFGPSSNRGCILVATSGPTTQHIAIHATADAEL